VKIEGSYTLSTPRDDVWEALNDPEVLSKTIPGGQELEKIAENEYRAKM
jgi:carbon monoxide dehydrogenase subunit G